MKIATWNIGSGINVNSYTEDLFDISPATKTDDTVLETIAKQIKDYDIDVIALQEVITTKSFRYIENLSEKTGMKYFVTFENSPCHLVKNTMFGIAFLSKFPLEVVKKNLLKNPNLTKTTEKGTYTSHDKGYMIVKIDAKKPIFVSCTQFLPFHRFGADIVKFKDIAKEYEEDNLKNETICCGDFNCIEGVPKLKNTLTSLCKTYEPAFDEVTTIDGKKCDNILTPKSFTIKSKGMVKNDLSSDHYMCFVEI